MWLYLPERVSPPAVLAARREHHGGHVGVPVSTWIAEAVNTPVPHTRSTARTVAADRSHEILDAATRAFAQHGYQATSLRSIAADMGLAHGTLLYSPTAGSGRALARGEMYDTDGRLVVSVVQEGVTRIAR